MRLAGLTAFAAVGFQAAFIYVVNWLQLVDGVAPERALDINTVSMAAMIPTTHRRRLAERPDRPQAAADCRIRRRASSAPCRSCG